MKDKLYIYCRVSTSSQSDEGVSLDVQEQRGIEVSKKNNLKPISIKEQGSGLKTYTEERPLFSSLMDKVSDGEVKHIWIDELTRLTRNDVDLPFISLEMKKNNVNLYVGERGSLKEWGFETKLLDTIITMVNQNQIKTQIRKSIRSKKRLFQEGCYMKGQSPFGYDLKDKKLILHPTNSQWVEKIFNWYDKGKSSTWIRQQLFENEIKPPLSWKTQNDWFPNETIMNILRNQNYIGIDTYGDLTNECPKIIDKKLFRSVQKKIKHNQGLSIIKQDFLLRGVIKCEDGKPMRTLGKKKSRRNPLYSCGHRDLKYKKRRKEIGDCKTSRSLRCDVLDTYTWELLCKTLEQSSLIKEQVKKDIIGTRKKGYTKRSINNKLKTLNNKMIELDKNTLELEKRYYTNKIKKSKYEVLMESISDTEDELLGKIDDLKLQLNSIKKNSEWIDWLEVHFNRIEKIRKTTELKEKKNLINHYIREIVVLGYDEEVHQHKMIFRFRFPLFNDKIQWIRNKDGSFKLDKQGRRKYKIIEGKDEIDLYSPSHNYSTVVGLVREGENSQVKKNSKSDDDTKPSHDYSTLTDFVREGEISKVNNKENTKPSHNHSTDTDYFGEGLKKLPYLVFDFYVSLNKFSPSPYFSKDISDRKELHDLIWELHSQGWGYTKIHKYLLDHNFEVSKHRTSIDHIIKKLIKRKRILSHPTTQKYQDFKLRYL
jgi:site-specific DNA recombinase